MLRQLTLLATCLVSVATARQPDDLSASLEAVRVKYHLPALGAALFTDHDIVAIGSTGVRAMGSTDKVTNDDLWHLGSCTKAMNATLIGEMVQKGELSWDLKLADALPELASSMHEQFKTVTLRQLLNMTAGVPSDLSADGLWGKLWKREGSPTEQRKQLAAAVLSHAPLTEPGTKFLYANASIAIAGYIAEVKTGQAWEKLIAERVFLPLKITSAGFGAPGENQAGVAQPRGHDAADKSVEPGLQADNPPAIGPAGTVHMSMPDWAKFLMLHVRAGSEGELLSASTMKTLHSPVLDQYAMGWMATKRSWGGDVLNHAGSNTMWYCVTWLSPEKKFGLLVCTNTAQHDAAKACDEVAGILVKRGTALGEKHPAPK
jgi:CubicO group peptidase (beta-lactamase class C family)